jgi:hypothetical protein
MGIGFVATVAGAILTLGGAGWKYAYLFPYSHAMLTVQSIHQADRGKSAMPQLTVDLLTKDIYVSLVVAAAVFILGYFIVLKKSVK